MNEAEFWDTLEYRICDELAQFKEKETRSLWCDGFVPQNYALLGRPIQSRASIAWNALMPPENKTGWLTIDRARKTIILTPPVKAQP
jgi:hypothetical protein